MAVASRNPGIPLAIIFAVVLTTLTIQTTSNRKSPSTVILIHTATTTFNPEKYEFLNCYIDPDSNGTSFSLTSNMLEDIQSNAYVIIAFHAKTKPADPYRPIFRYDFDMCKLFQGIMRQSIARTWFRHLKRFSNFPNSCPIRRGYYFIRDMTISPLTIPPFIRHGHYLINGTFYVKRNSINDWYANGSTLIEITDRR